MSLRYYQIYALYFTEAVLREVREQGAGKGAGLKGLRRNMLAYWMATGSGKTPLMTSYTLLVDSSKAERELGYVQTPLDALLRRIRWRG